MITALLLPAVALFAAAVVVARVVERAMPETPAGLALQAAIASAVMTGLSAAVFAALYAGGAAPVSAMLRADPGGGLAHFAGLGLKAALIWGPPVLLVVITAPRRWRHARW